MTGGDGVAGPGVVLLDPDYPIGTARLLLRPWRVDEFTVYHRLRGDPEVVTYLYDEPFDLEQARTRLASARSVITEPGQWLNLAVVVAATGEVAGDVGLCWASDVHRRAEIGYTFFAAHRGNGYATEAASAVVDLAFAALGAHRVCGRIDARNAASARVLERLGMRREAHFVENEWVKGEWTDEIVYAVLATEWLRPRSAT